MGEQVAAGLEKEKEKEQKCFLYRNRHFLVRMWMVTQRARIKVLTRTAGKC